MIMIFIPLFNGIKAIRWPGIYGLMNRVWKLTPLRKISIGFFLTVPAFVVPAWIEQQLDAGIPVNISIQLLAYVLITAAEVFVSITCLEFSYTQAPKRMKSLVMGLFLLSVSLGNVFVSVVNLIIQNDDGTSKLAGPDYYLFFAATMAVTAVLFIPVAMLYKEKTYIQDEEDAEPASA
jgi:POT family proton-dependent oligopeptide transporter